MVSLSLFIAPILGILIIIVSTSLEYSSFALNESIKKIGLFTSLLNLIISLTIFVLFDNSSNQFQFVQDYYSLEIFDLYLGLDGLSIYFVLLTTFITPIALLSN